MGTHLIDGEFQSDKYPTTPRGKVPLSVKDKMAQDLLWTYAERRRPVDAEFSADLQTALHFAGYIEAPPASGSDDAAYSIVEIFGHRRHVGRTSEVEQFGTKMLRIDVPKDGDFALGHVTHFYGGASIFGIVPTDLATVQRVNAPTQQRVIGRYRHPDGEDHDEPEF